MLFNSYIFILVFLPTVFVGYFYLNSKRLVLASKVWLIFTSLFFYSYWTVDYLPLILSSILINYAISRSMEQDISRFITKKALLFIGLVFNIGLLSFYKYMDFFIFNINALLNLDITLLQLLLPLAISFFTLQQIAFLIDAYEGLSREKSLVDYALFVLFFPQLIAGPIVHHKEMMPQFKSLRNKTINYDNIALGLFIFSIGLFKKVVLADTFAEYANIGFNTPEALSFLQAWQTSLSYTFQLYFDFSGYADMAIGIGLLFNIRLPQNFNSPFKATSIIDFWQRWHITLTKFITTYIYTPLLKSITKVTFAKAMFATFISIFIAGIWHGAGWTFVMYGLIHGIALLINHNWRKRKIKMPKFLAWFILFNFISIAFVVFRAADLTNALNVITGMYLPHELGSMSVFSFILINLGFVIVFLFQNSTSCQSTFKATKSNLFFIIGLSFVSLIFLSQPTEFLYFQF